MAERRCFPLGSGRDCFPLGSRSDCPPLAACSSVTREVVDIVDTEAQFDFRAWLWCSQKNTASLVLPKPAAGHGDLDEDGSYIVPPLDARFAIWEIPSNKGVEYNGRMVSFIGGIDIPVGLKFSVAAITSDHRADYGYATVASLTAEWAKSVNPRGGCSTTWKDELMNPNSAMRELWMTHCWLD